MHHLTTFKLQRIGQRPVTWCSVFDGNGRRHAERGEVFKTAAACTERAAVGAHARPGNHVRYQARWPPGAGPLRQDHRSHQEARVRPQPRLLRPGKRQRLVNRRDLYTKRGFSEEGCVFGTGVGGQVRAKCCRLLVGGDLLSECAHTCADCGAKGADFHYERPRTPSANTGVHAQGASRVWAGNNRLPRVSGFEMSR